MTHSSVMPMEFAGRKMYVYCASGGVVGVSREDGALLWETNEWKISIATIPSPIVCGEGRIFLTGGYNAGSMMLQLREEPGGRLVARPLFRLPPKVFDCEQQTPILREGHLYSVRTDGQLACMGLGGELRWASGSAERYGLGPFMSAGGMLFVMNDKGVLSLVDANPEGQSLLARARVLDGHESWGPMALAGGRLLARDLTRMVCLDVRRKTEATDAPGE